MCQPSPMTHLDPTSGQTGGLRETQSPDRMGGEWDLLPGLAGAVRSFLFVFLSQGRGGGAGGG